MTKEETGVRITVDHCKDMYEALTNIIKAASFCHADAGLKIWIDEAKPALAKARG